MSCGRRVCIQSCSFSSRHRLIQFKVLHRLPKSNIKLYKIFRSVSSLCERYGTAEASLSHLFWYCPVLSHFWSEMFNCMPKHCNLVIFGCSGSKRALPSHQKQILRMGMVAAKNLILLNWKSTFSLNEKLSIAKMEQICYYFLRV